MDDTYFTIQREATAEIKVKGSRFIAESRLVKTVEEATGRLEGIRKREYQATHHCPAYHIGLGNDAVFKYSDDGEPSGTAGKPIYDVIAGRDLTNILVVVTRYFGGTKLGTGGLVRAYGDAAKAVLDKSGVKENYLTSQYHLELDFTYFNSIQQLINKLEIRTLNSEFTDAVSLDIAVRLSREEQFCSEFVELTQGKAHLEKKDES
jgi:uncharacterized YigZ family protein